MRMFDTYTKSAKINHKCSKCKITIKVGESYYTITEREHPGAFTYKTKFCVACYNLLPDSFKLIKKKRTLHMKPKETDSKRSKVQKERETIVSFKLRVKSDQDLIDITTVMTAAAHMFYQNTGVVDMMSDIGRIHPDEISSKAKKFIKEMKK